MEAVPQVSITVKVFVCVWEIISLLFYIFSSSASCTPAHYMFALSYLKKKKDLFTLYFFKYCL